MPTIGHVLYGLCVIIPILYYTKDEFNYKIAFIFLANNIFGPDLVALFFVIPTHNIIGFAILAIPLALIFSYSSRFSLKKSDGLFPLKFQDDGISEINWKNSYCVTVAGGISHFFIDQFYHWEKEMYLFPGVSISHDEMLSWSGTAYHNFVPLMILGDIIVVSMILLSLYYFRKGYKETFKFLIIAAGISIFLMVFVSTAVFSGEREYGVMVHSLVYVLIPFFLLMYAARDVRDNPIETPDVPKIKRKTLLNIVAVISILVSLFFILYAYMAITSAKTIAVLLAGDGGDVNAAIATVTFFGYFFLITSVILLISSIGLFLKIKVCRYIVIAICSYFFIFVFPFAITLFLCEEDVKAMFNKGSED